MNVELKIVSIDDIEKIRAWRNSPLIQNVSYNRDFITAEMQLQWFTAIKSNYNQLHWIISINGNDAGYAAIKNIDITNKRCEFASLYIAETQFLLNGAGALAEYHVIEYVYNNYSEINKIYCEVLSFNRKVIQLHKRFGFVTEGELRQQFLLNDQLENVTLLALFKDNWNLKKTNISNLLKRI